MTWNPVFTQQDPLTQVETIGDAYLAVTNLLEDQADSHAARMARFALQCISASTQTLIDLDDPARGVVRIRAGFHSGPVVAQVVGNKYKKFSLIGVYPIIIIPKFSFYKLSITF